MNKHLKLLFIGFLTFSQTFAQKKEITNELIWASRTFAAASVDEVKSMKDGEHFTALDQAEQEPTEINKYAYKDYSKKGTIVASKDLKYDNKRVDIEEYDFNADESMLLLATNVKFVYRRSYLANYYIYDIKNKTIKPLADTSKGKQMLAEFSPDGKRIAFVRDNDIYIHELATGIETAVTTDGEKNKIINGGTDWVYEEEFGFAKGFYWSNDSKFIAYYRFDESDVKDFTMTFYGDLYPELYTFKYPKAGEANSFISIRIYDVEKGFMMPVNLGGEDIYIPRIKWANQSGKLCVLRMNRLQNKLEYCFADAGTMSKENDPVDINLKVIYTEESDTYVEITDDLIFLNKKEAFIRTSEKNGFNHIYLIGFDGTSKQITTGDWDVVSFKGLDESKNLVYYISAETSPMEKDLYSIKLDGTGKKKLSTRNGTNDPIFSSGMKYYINYHTDANTPYYITLHSADGKELKVLESNEELINRMSQYEISKKEFFSFTTSENVKLNCWMIKPPKFDENKKYPVYFYLYGGPGKNEVEDDWGGQNYFWHQMLAQKGYLVVCMDPRGTMFRGEKFKKMTYLQLGKYEAMDCIEFAKYLGGLAYVDKDRIGIQGWSYGGYMTLLGMTKGADYFKAGISVAPVTNWRYYDNIYTERFMRTPQENASGYDDNSPINHVKKLKGKLLLVHGSGDDNVHYQNTMEMISAFVNANKQFELFIYPNKNHSIAGGYTRLNLYTKMTNFILENL